MPDLTIDWDLAKELLDSPGSPAPPGKQFLILNPVRTIRVGSLDSPPFFTRTNYELRPNCYTKSISFGKEVR